MKAILLCTLLLAGCAQALFRTRGPGLIFEDASTPIDYRADVLSGDREVHGESCRNAVGLPLFLFGGFDLVGWDEAGYRDAVAKAQAQAPGTILTDIRADMHFINILVFRRECLVVTAAAR